MDKNPSDEDLVIEVEPEIAEAPEIKVDEPEKHEPTAEEAIETLKQQLEASEREKALAAQRAQNAESQVHTARIEVQDTNLQLVNNALEQTKANATILKQNLAAAWTSGDMEQAANIQEAIALNANRLVALEQGKYQMENAPRQQPVVIADPVERLASQLQDPTAKAWIRAHPEYAAGNKFEELKAADQLARARGIDASSPAYYTAVEATLGLGARQEEPVQTRRAAAPVAAPVSRGGNGGGSTPQTVRLSAAQREAARLSGLTDKEYALNLVAARSKGEIN